MTKTPFPSCLARSTRRAALRPAAAVVGVALLAWAAATLHGQQAPERARPEETFRFRSGVELINVTTTVSDASGRFVSGLRKEDFVVYDDDQPVELTHFSAERVPVSLGIAIDTSGSMAGDKIRAAEAALERFAFQLLDKDDELFLYRFSNAPTLVQGWTSDRQLIGRALGRLGANGGTALYDAVAEAIPLASRGKYQKKALVIISDGNDTSSQTDVRAVKQLIRESEVLVYAIGIDAADPEPSRRTTPLPPPPPRIPIPFPQPFPRPGAPRPFPSRSFAAQAGGQGGSWPRSRGGDDRVNVSALRDMTDDSGGRTEIIRHIRDLDPATAGIADELSRQYYLGYPSTAKKDGRWHSIRVELRNSAYRVRARRGYVAG